MNSLRSLGSAIFVGLLLTSGLGLNVFGQAPGLNDQGQEGNPKKAASTLADKARLLIWHTSKFVFVTPEGKKIGELPQPPEERVILTGPALSPDGKRVAFPANENPPTDEEGNLRRHVLVCDLNGKDRWIKIPINAQNVFWTPDGKNLIASELLPGKQIKDRGIAAWSVDVKTKEKTQLELPRWALPSGMTPDGKSFVAALFDIDARKIHLVLISRDGKNVSKLTEVRTEGPDAKVSPDGNKLLFQDYDSTEKPEKEMPPLPRLFIYDLGSKKCTRLEGVPLNADLNGYCWSPDGKQIAYTWKQVQPGVPLAINTNNMNDPKLNTETESHLMIADADGKNARTVLSEKAPSGPTVTIEYVDWR
jgi:Tol biopolymer transport system component